MKSSQIILLFLFVFSSATCLAETKEPKYVLPDAPPAQQWEYIQSLLVNAEVRMADHDYSEAQLLLTERCELLDLYYEKNGTTSVIGERTGYEYIVIVPKLYCNLRIGHIENNLKEIAHLREQYEKLFNKQHPQDDLLETEVAETYFRMGNIGMAIETAEKLLLRLHIKSDHSSVAYHKMYYRLMAYYKSIGRSGTPYFEKNYEPENGISKPKEMYSYLIDDNLSFQQKMTNIVESAAKFISEDEIGDARDVIELGMNLLDQEFPLSARMQAPENEHRYNLMKVQLLTMQAKTYRYIYFSDSKAEKCLLDCYKLKKKLFGENSTEVTDAAEALGRYYFNGEENNAEAIKYYQEARNILESTNEYRKGQLIDIMGAMMQCYVDNDEVQMAATLAKELIAAMKDMIVASFAVSSSAERAALWDKYNHWLLTDIPRLALKYEDRVDLGAELYDIALFSKGLLILSDNVMTELVMKKGSAELKQEGRKLHELRLQLQRQLTSSDFFEQMEVNFTRRETEEVEHSLVVKVSQLGNWHHGLSIDWRDIQKRLKKGETAIEFLEFGETFWERGAIIAIVLSADSRRPVMRKLCSSSYLSYSQTFTHCKDTNFYKRLWSNIEPELTHTTTLFFSPVGVLNTIPIEYCPVDSTRFLFDKYNMYRLTSTRKILERGKSKNISSAYVFGGIDYTPNLNELQAANVALMNEGIIDEGTSELSKDMKIDTSNYRSNGIVNQSNWMNIYTSSLSSTTLLSDFLNMMNCNVHSFNNFRATEECFKSMSRKPIDAVFVDTHGFTFDPYLIKSNNYSFTYKDEINHVSKPEMAMTLSGLLLSGASMAYSPNCDRDCLEDGIITASEIAQLNLQNVQLVHLSACETGLGEITAEGVLGLQRGFKRAGAKAIINSLAPTYTSMETYFNTTFYRNLFYKDNGKKRKKQSIHDAFYTSVRKIKSIHKDTKHWCVNILIDALD